MQCTRAGATCFCASMGTGPEVTEGYDLVLTELDDGFLVERRHPGRERGCSPTLALGAGTEARATAAAAWRRPRAAMAGTGSPPKGCRRG